MLHSACVTIMGICLKDLGYLFQVRPIQYTDFDAALSQVRASVSQKDLDTYIEWNTLYGSGSK